MRRSKVIKKNIKHNNGLFIAGRLRIYSSSLRSQHNKYVSYCILITSNKNNACSAQQNIQAPSKMCNTAFPINAQQKFERNKKQKNRKKETNAINKWSASMRLTKQSIQYIKHTHTQATSPDKLGKASIYEPNCWHTHSASTQTYAI